MEAAIKILPNYKGCRESSSYTADALQRKKSPASLSGSLTSMDSPLEAVGMMSQEMRYESSDSLSTQASNDVTRAASPMDSSNTPPGKERAWAESKGNHARNYTGWAMPGRPGMHHHQPVVATAVMAMPQQAVNTLPNHHPSATPLMMPCNMFNVPCSQPSVGELTHHHMPNLPPFRRGDRDATTPEMLVGPDGHHRFLPHQPHPTPHYQHHPPITTHPAHSANEGHGYMRRQGAVWQAPPLPACQSAFSRSGSGGSARSVSA